MTAPVSRGADSRHLSRRRAVYLETVVKAVAIFGVAGGVLIAVLKVIEYRFLVVEHSLAIYGGLVAAIFAAVGIWLGVTLTRTRKVVVVKEVPAPEAPFEVDEAKVRELGITQTESRVRGPVHGLRDRQGALG